MKLLYPAVLLSALLALPAFAETESNKGATSDSGGTTTSGPSSTQTEQSQRHQSSDSKGQMLRREASPETRETRPQTFDDSDEPQMEPGMNQDEQAPYDDEDESGRGVPGSSGTYRRAPVPEDME